MKNTSHQKQLAIKVLKMKRAEFWSPYILFFIVFLSISPVPGIVTGIGANITFLILSVIFIANKKLLNLHFNRKFAVFLILVPLLTLPTAIFWRESGVILFPIYFVFSFIIISISNRENISKFSEISTLFLLIVSTGAWIGFIYALLGGESLFSIENPDGRENAFFLTTFSNFYIGSFIRPSGIFDEPGSLSFIICFIAGLRHKLDQPKKATWQLLLLGIITLSIAHFIYVIFHALQDRSYLLSGKKTLISVISIICLLIATSFFAAGDEAEIFFSRFVVTDGKLTGDSRSDLFYSALDRIDSVNLFFGLDVDCIVKSKVCEGKGHGQFGETPAGIILLLGLFLSFPYFLILIWLLYSAILWRDFVATGLLLLLLQRPYVMNYGYSLLILIAVLDYGKKVSIVGSSGLRLKSERPNR